MRLVMLSVTAAPVSETLPAFCFNSKMDSGSLLPVVAMMQTTESRK